MFVQSHSFPQEGKAYSNFNSKWLKEIFYHGVDKHSAWHYLKAECTPSDAIHNPNHKVWVMVTKHTGQVKKAHCTCFAG